MNKKGVLRKNPDVDFFIGFIGGEAVPSKQEKFKLVKDVKELILNNGDHKLVDDGQVYFKKDGTDSLKIFEQKFQELIKENLKSEHPYKREISLELIISVSMDKKRLNQVDIDNLVKAILDCMKGLVFEDDAQVVNILATKDVNEFIPLNGLLVGVRKLVKKESWFKDVKLATAEIID